MGPILLLLEEMYKNKPVAEEPDWDALPDEEHPLYCPEFWEGGNYDPFCD